MTTLLDSSILDTQDVSRLQTSADNLKVHRCVITLAKCSAQQLKCDTAEYIYQHKDNHLTHNEKVQKIYVDGKPVLNT